ncbi:polyphenol oxidase, chloroplastic-like [Aristolochia californica]|uniref:polyphenol oxidase, chloroplastic-like n=1 Tax=Aristolochia californica TaxID=171875 RepID=UPI0035DCF929
MALSMLLASPSLITSSSTSSSFPDRPPRTGLRSSVLRSPRPRRVTTSIRSSSENGEASRPLKVDRRNVLLGLGGLYGATTLGGNQSAVGAPVEYPILESCHVANYPDEFGGNNPIECCPPYNFTNPINLQPYVFPTNVPLRTRKAAHLLTQWEKDRFQRAIAEMKNLPSDHPWSFVQQSRIHCAYCSGSYNQRNSAKILQVHFSWLFLPWHRYYIYFFERILGKIIGDETFALPFWNYDSRDGMMFPSMYLDPNSSLYNPNRNRSHFPLPINLNYSFDIEDRPPVTDPADANIAYLRRIFTDSAPIPELFMGSPVRAGQDPSARLMSGMLENLHNVVHNWIGLVEPPNLDMGNFFSAARDTLFYAHHANIDRLWSIYRSQLGNQLEFNDRDWLNASFVFYDENEKVVSITVRQCLNQMDMGYVYQNVPVEYLNSPPTFTPRAAAPTPPLSSVSEFGPTPRPLSSTIRAVVRRPRTSRSATEKRREAEVLSIDDIELNGPETTRFDVYVNKLTQGSSVAGPGTFAGSFVRVRHNHLNEDGSHTKTIQKFGITSLLDEIGADADENVVVTLIPRDGNVTIGGVHVELTRTFSN